MTGVELIAKERERHTSEKGWTAEHDDYHCKAELALAAASYVLWGGAGMTASPLIWPFASYWWKPGDRVRSLVKAGALIAAEIDRIQRAIADLDERCAAAKAKAYQSDEVPTEGKETVK